MGEVIAGWAAGYIMALVSTLALVYLLARGSESRFVQHLSGGETRPMLLSIPVALGSFLAWTLAGLVLGSAYRLGGLEGEADVLGSPSAPFLLAMVAIGATPLPLLVIAWPRLWWMWCGLAASFVGLFGWFMPLLAARF